MATIKKKVSLEKGRSAGKKLSFKENIKQFVSPFHVSTNRYERESASADLTSLSSYHYKFKKNYLASYVIRPGTTRELTTLIKRCWEYSMPITIRAAGTSCFSSATPSKGGVIIGMRRLNQIIEINTQQMTVKVGAGISWLNLIEALSDYGLAPKCYPTSFKTSCVSGFIATPGKAGIGVPKYGSMENTVISMTVVRPNGSMVVVSRDSTSEITLDDIFGTYGIYGAIAEVELSITTLKTSLEVVGYGFNSYKDAVRFYLTLKNEITSKPFFLSISQRDFEKYAHVYFPEHKWLVWAVFYDDPKENVKSLVDTEISASNLNGKSVDKAYLKEKWRDISDAEVAIGRSTRNLIFQEFWVSDERLVAFYKDFSKEKKKYKFESTAYTMSGNIGWSRIKIFALTDISKPLEFFAAKAFLHDRAVKTFKQGDRVYTIGIVNTFYLHKYRAGEVDNRRVLKKELDPDDNFNSYRIINTRMKFWRINLLFNMSKLLYKLF